MDGQISILFVDDDPHFSDLVATNLARVDTRFSVTSVTSANGAIERLEGGNFDCIVSDYAMPNTNGLELLSRVRERFRDLPYILFTGNGSEMVASEAISAGVSDYLQKQPGQSQYELLANRIRTHVERVRAERARQRHLEAIETAREGISILDEAGEFVYVNQSYADIYGYEPDEMLGEHWEMVYPDDKIDEIRNEVLPHVESTGSWRGETVGLRADGGMIIEDHSLSRTDQGGLVCTIYNITEHKARDRELESKTRAMDRAPVGILLTDPKREDNPIVYANEHFQRMTGYDEAEILGRNCRFLQGEKTDPEAKARLRHAVENETSTTVELRNYRADGSEFWNRVTIAPVRDDTGAVTHFVGFQQDVTDRRELQQTLRAREEHLEQAQSVAGIGTWQCDMDAEEIYWSSETYDLFGDIEKPLSFDQFLETVHPDDRVDVEDVWANGYEDGRFDIEYRIVTDSERTRWVRTSGEVRYDSSGSPRNAIGVTQDITREKQHERRLTALNEATQRLHGATSRKAVGAHVIDILSETFDGASGCVYLLDETSGMLEPIYCTMTECRVSQGPFEPGEGHVGETFRTNHSRVETDPGLPKITGSNILYVPIGNVGVIVIDATRIDDRTRELAEIIASAAREAIIRIDNQKRLTVRESQLEAQSGELDRVERTTRKMHHVLSGIGDTDCRDSIQETVCRRLADADEFDFVWFGSIDPVTDCLEPQAIAGREEGYLSTIDRSLDDGESPAVRAAETRQLTTVENTAKVRHESDWRREAMARGFRSTLCVPITIENVLYGVLTIHANETHIFQKSNEQRYEYLGWIIAQAIARADQRAILAGDQIIEGTLEITDNSYPLINISHSIQRQLRIESLTPQNDGTIVLVTSPELHNTELSQRLRDVPEVIDVSMSDESRVVRMRLGTSDGLQPIVDAGGVVTGGEVDSTRAKIHANFPNGVEIHGVIERIEHQYPSTNLLAFTSRDGIRESEGFDLLGDLTRRQQDVLMVAHQSGYFEWPRAVTIEQLAKSFDIASSTCSRHLRIGQQKLLQTVFEDGSTDE